MDSYESWSSNSQASSAELEAKLYQHLQHCRQSEPTATVLERFNQLFIQADGYLDPDVWDVLVELVHRPQANREFKYTLNRCSYTLINPWYTQPRDHWAIPALVKQFEAVPNEPSANYATHSIRQRVQEFLETEQYASLWRMAQIFDPAATDDGVEAVIDEQPVAQQLRRYPFLYDSSLLTKDSDQHQKEHVMELRQKAEAAIGVKLARYRNHRQGGDRAFPNPTRLPQDQLDQALGYYTGKVEGCNSHRDLAQMFQTYSKTARSFRIFKEELLEYLLAPLADVEPRYVNGSLGKSLRQYLQNTLKDFDDQPLNEFVVITTCQKLLNFLVAEGTRQKPVYRRFWQLLNEVGYALTVGLLLRIVLFCDRVKPWLENRLSVLFNHHENHRCKEVPWLMETLEHMNVALITNFGKIGYSF
jgi:hypothetical protein